NDAVLALAKNARIREVILEARWAKYAEGTSYGVEPKGRVVLRDKTSAGAHVPRDNHEVFARGLSRTVSQLKALGKTVVIVASVPEVGWPVPAILARRALAQHTDSADVNPRLRRYLARQKFVLAAFD